MASTIDDTEIQLPDWDKFGRPPKQGASGPTDESYSLALLISRIDRLIDALEKTRFKPAEELETLAGQIAAKVSPNALWHLAEVAEYLHRSEQHTRQWIITLSGFPRPIRIPSGKSATERARPLWRSKDVIEWAESYVEA
ncbi:MULTISPECIES: hypothetical protein [unclassified Burkholderia]|uniref:helix-turn-helix transcriptional regulator n=1 Tax=unclassified Burkholderia TaxID=2613784 RepID=UPI002AB0C12B|nr:MULTISPECIES: hypothetical protein [unclassified Burkholderia]